MTWTLIYDGECSLCAAAAAWAKGRARSGALEVMPCRSQERKARFPHMAEEVCLKAMQLISPEGRVYSGHESFPHLLGLMPCWRYVAWTLRLPGMALLSSRLYAWVAGHRHALSIIIREEDADHGSPGNKN